jgi:hypothetical protein
VPSASEAGSGIGSSSLGPGASYLRAQGIWKPLSFPIYRTQQRNEEKRDANDRMISYEGLAASTAKNLRAKIVKTRTGESFEVVALARAESSATNVPLVKINRDLSRCNIATAAREREE